MGTRAVTVTVWMAALGAALGLAASAPLGADYPSDAGPPIRALLDGDPRAFLAAQPLMGVFSLLLRAPFAALATLGDGGELLVYRLGAFPCLVAAGTLAAALARWMAEAGQPPYARLAVGALCVANPLTFQALRWGHPEEVLGGALCVGAVAVAARGRWLAAGVLLGLALATKQWALIAVLPVLVAAPRGRGRLLALAAAIAALATLPLAVGNPQRFAASTQSIVYVAVNISPVNAWWPLTSATERDVSDGVDTVTVTSYSMPAVLRSVTHPLIVAAPLPLALLYWRRRKELEPYDALGLLALLFLLRCVLDPVNIGYYHLPFLLALAGWEGLRRRGLPVLTMSACTALWVTFERIQELRHDWVTWSVYMSWSLPLVVLLALTLLAARPHGEGADRLARPLDLA